MDQDRIDFFRGGAGPIRPQAFFFYHLPKCGGMTIHTLARTCWEQMAKHQGFAPPVVERVDDLAAAERLEPHPYALLSSHLPYGVHRRFVGAPLLMTILRDPVDRVRSAYAYHCMHGGETTTPDGFAAFFQHPENQNVMTRLLCGGGDIDATAPDRVAQTLNENFALYATSKDIRTLSETFLRTCSLPNVITTRINKTPSRYAIDAAPFADEIRAVNAYDGKLFEHVRTHKKCTIDGRAGDGIVEEHPLSVILVERHHDENMIAKGFAVPTAFLREIKLLGGDGIVDGDIYRDFIRSVEAQGILD